MVQVLGKYMNIRYLDPQGRYKLVLQKNGTPERSFQKLGVPLRGYIRHLAISRV